jgi:hypothetical protein
MKFLEKIKFNLNPSYRVLYGMKLWEELNKKLPPAVGIIAEDELRMEMFGELTLNMSNIDKVGLITYLEHSLEQIEIWRDEFQTSSEEAEENRQKHIINEHLRILTGSSDD